MRTAGEPFMRWTLRCAKRENQDLSVLVTRGASARGARARGPRPEARCPRPEVRGPRSEVRDRGVSARSQPEVCVTREVAKQFIQHNTVIHSSYMTHYFMLNMISLRISCCLYGIYRLCITFGAMVNDDQPGHEKKLSHICIRTYGILPQPVADNC